MMEFLYYSLQLCAFAALLALSIYIYIDGLGYVTFHLLGVAGVAGYSFARLATESAGLALAVAAGLLTGLLAGWVSAEIFRPLRGDALTLATFGLGVGFFEFFRYANWTGGVYGISGIPSFFDTGRGRALLGLGTTAFALLLIYFWRRSTGGAVLKAIRLDEDAALSLGARLGAHQRISGALAGVLASSAGIYYASIAGFLEPRDFRATNLLIPLAAAIFAAGRSPIHAVALATGIIITAQGFRFVGNSPALAGPISEITLSLAVATFVVYRRTRDQARTRTRLR